jgi:dephospho-CoA kinase
MYISGLTGGIGSGKSLVSSIFSSLGANCIDCDVLARKAVEPGTQACKEILSRFGASVFSADGSLDRQKMAQIAFNDSQALSDLNEITHPAVGNLMAQELAKIGELETTSQRSQIVILEIPLLTSSTKQKYLLDSVIVVDADEETRFSRLVNSRKMDVLDVRARMAAQISRDDRLALSDYVIDNSSDEEHLKLEVDKCWAWLKSQAFSKSS